MVAVRKFHLIDLAKFKLSEWCADMQLPQQLSANLTNIEAYYAKHISDPETYIKLFSEAIEMVDILHNLNMDSDTLIASALFPIVQNNIVNLDQISEDFGDNIKKLIVGVLEMDNIRYLNTDQSVSDPKVDNIRKMLLAMVDDFRCVIIKLAERILFLREVQALTEEERVITAKECSEIYAPLANRLGIGQLKWELEDYSFHYLNPKEYKNIAKLLAEKRIDRENYINDFITQLNTYLAESIKDAKVYGRPKHIYSIWLKMKKKHLEFSELFDVRAIRIIVDRLQDCYTALGIVHTHFKHIPQEFDDYIANPKPNGYQSIHTVVLGEGGKPIEVQIRTQQMHDDAELGVAAHWTYKEGENAGKHGYQEKIAWLRKLLDWQDEISDANEMIAEMRSQVFDDRVYVFTPKGEVIDLPVNATPLDFAYTIHSEVGHRCIGAKINGRIVPFTYHLRMGEQVDIITQKNPNPSRDWLNPNAGFINTHRARNKVQSWFKKLDKEKNIPIGRELLEAELVKHNLSLKDVEKYIMPRYNIKHLDDIFAGVGSGDLRVNQIINYLQSQLSKNNPAPTDAEALKHISQKTSHYLKPHNDGYIVVEGVGNLMHHMAKCCQPIPGDDIKGFITQGFGISIHKSNCSQLLALQAKHSERIIAATWSSMQDKGFNVGIKVVANDHSGALRDVTAILANEKINVLKITSSNDIKRNLVSFEMDIELLNVDLLPRILFRINQLQNVIEAKKSVN